MFYDVLKLSVITCKNVNNIVGTNAKKNSRQNLFKNNFESNGSNFEWTFFAKKILFIAAYKYY